jgi:hypothetical protein
LKKKQHDGDYINLLNKLINLAKQKEHHKTKIDNILRRSAAMRYGLLM